MIWTCCAAPVLAATSIATTTAGGKSTPNSRVPVVPALFDLIRFRNTHPAFAGEFHLLPCADHEIHIEWRNGGEWARLEVDLKTTSATISHSAESGERRLVVAPGAAREVAR